MWGNKPINPAMLEQIRAEVLAQARAEMKGELAALARERAEVSALLRDLRTQVALLRREGEMLSPAARKGRLLATVGNVCGLLPMDQAIDAAKKLEAWAFQNTDVPPTTEKANP